MPRNSKNRRSARKRKHSGAEKRPSRTSGVAARGARPFQSGAVEPTSGSESSPLDPKRKAISVPDEYRVPVTSGQLSGTRRVFHKRILMIQKASESWWRKGRIWKENWCKVLRMLRRAIRAT
jgi:hypothetical protein